MTNIWRRKYCRYSCRELLRNLEDEILIFAKAHIQDTEMHIDI